MLEKVEEAKKELEAQLVEKDKLIAEGIEHKEKIQALLNDEVDRRKEE